MHIGGADDDIAPGNDKIYYSCQTNAFFTAKNIDVGSAIKSGSRLFASNAKPFFFRKTAAIF
jgi:hypothetical protein